MARAELKHGEATNEEWFERYELLDDRAMLQIHDSIRELPSFGTPSIEAFMQAPHPEAYKLAAQPPVGLLRQLPRVASETVSGRIISVDDQWIITRDNQRDPRYPQGIGEIHRNRILQCNMRTATNRENSDRVALSLFDVGDTTTVDGKHYIITQEGLIEIGRLTKAVLTKVSHAMKDEGIITVSQTTEKFPDGLYTHTNEQAFVSLRTPSTVFNADMVRRYSLAEGETLDPEETFILSVDEESGKNSKRGFDFVKDRFQGRLPHSLLGLLFDIFGCYPDDDESNNIWEAARVSFFQTQSTPWKYSQLPPDAVNIFLREILQSTVDREKLERIFQEEQKRYPNDTSVVRLVWNGQKNVSDVRTQN